MHVTETPERVHADDHQRAGASLTKKDGESTERE